MNLLLLSHALIPKEQEHWQEVKFWQLLRLNAFRGEPASSEFDWNFTTWMKTNELTRVSAALWSVHCIRALYTVWHVVRFYLGNHSNMPNRTDYHAFQERVRPRDGAVLSNCWQIYVFAYSFATCKWVLFTLCAHCFPNPLKDFRNI